MKEARREWIKYRATEDESSGLVSNGGFEEDIFNGGFGWRLRRIEGVDIKTDNRVFFRGKRSLRVEFDGRHNLDFSHVFQITPLEPRTRYILSANIMTEKITTTNGIFMQFYGINDCKFSRKTEVLTGTNAWKELTIELSTPPDCDAGAVRFRREKSEKFNNLIGGSAWIDGVRLEKSYAETP
jgi:hypothetical protein